MSRHTSSLIAAALAVGVATGMLLIQHGPLRAESSAQPRGPWIAGPLVSLSVEVVQARCEVPEPPQTPEACEPPEADVEPAEQAPLLEKPTVDPAPRSTCAARHMRPSEIPVLQPPLEVETVVASPWDVRLLAVHDGEAVMISRDEGRTWTAALPTPQDESSVLDMAFDCTARLHVFAEGGSLGVYDPGTGSESWQRVEVLAGADEARLLVDRSDVALLGPDPARADQLILVRHDEALGWSPKAVFADNDYGSWDGVSIDHIERRGGGGFKVWLAPWQGGECGWGGYAELHVNTRTARARSISKGDESEEHPDWPNGDNNPVTDAAGRVLLIDYEEGGPMLRRLSAAEHRERLAERAEDELE